MPEIQKIDIAAEEDRLIREILTVSGCDFTAIAEADDLSKYSYYKDGDLQIRTCLKCKLSEFKSCCGLWILYFTKERMLYVCDYIIEYKEYPKYCENCG
jgi:hypothetical protein